MDEAQMFEFDLNGVIVIPNVLPQPLVQHMNSVIDGACADGIIDDERSSDRFNFAQVAALDPAFMETMASPTTLEVIRVMCGDWLRLDHAYGIHMDHTWSGRENLHGGNRMATGEHQYQWFQGRMYNGLIVVMYALEDVNPGDGGFICVPGTHKANLPYRPTFDSHLVLNPTMKAGDMLIFTEALIHGTCNWNADTHKRRALLYKYSPGYSTWGNPENLEPLRQLATTDMQRELLRPPGVGGRDPLPLPDAGAWGDSGKAVGIGPRGGTTSKPATSSKL